MKILPCPFCGGTKNIVCETWFEGEARNAYAVSCMTVNCHGGVFRLGSGDFQSEAEAIEAWNERAPYIGSSCKATDSAGNEIEACPHGVLSGWCYKCGDVNKGIQSFNVWVMPKI